MPTTTKNSIDAVIKMDNRRMRLGIKKGALCQRAGIKAEMYSYVLKRGETGRSLPEETMAKIYRALDAFEAEAKRANGTTYL